MLKRRRQRLLFSTWTCEPLFSDYCYSASTRNLLASGGGLCFGAGGAYGRVHAWHCTAGSSARHVGHCIRTFIHWSRHCEWKACPHGVTMNEWSTPSLLRPEDCSVKDVKGRGASQITVRRIRTKCSGTAVVRLGSQRTVSLLRCAASASISITDMQMTHVPRSRASPPALVVPPPATTPRSSPASVARASRAPGSSRW